MSLPFIDMSGLRSGNSNDRAQIGLEIRSACLDKGFFYLTGHGISKSSREEAMNVVRKFFSQPLEIKLETDKAFTDAH